MPASLEEPAARRVSLAPSSLLLHALAGRGLTLQSLPLVAADGPDTANAAPPAHARAILTRTHLLLPELWPDLQHAAVAHAVAHLLYSTPSPSSAPLKPLAQVVVGAVEDARVEQLLAHELPGVRAWFDAPLRVALEPEGLSCTALLSRLDLALHDEQHPDGNHWIHKARTLFMAARQAHGLEDATAFRRLASVLANDLGQMRVRHDPQRFAVPAPYRDDHSYLWMHARTGEIAQALQAPSPSLTAPSPTSSPSSTREGPDDTPVATLEHTISIHHYPEWNRRLERLRPDWCTLHELAPAEAEPFASRLGPEAARLRPAWWHRPDAGHGQRLRRQPEGEALDLDAAIEAAVARRLRHAHDGRVFQRPGPRQLSWSLLLLLDCSASTGDEDAQGRSLLTVERQAAWQLAQAVQTGRGRIAIHAFSSDTRARVRYQRLLDFGQPLDARARARLEALQAAWSTRLGAALRHASRLLAAEPTERRILLVLSDGAPSDIDVPDTRDLVEDARQAVREATKQGVAVHGFIVNPDADTGMDTDPVAAARRIFGVRQIHVLQRAKQLARQLVALHARFSSI